MRSSFNARDYAPLCWLILTLGRLTLPFGVGMFESFVSLDKLACPFLSNMETLGPKPTEFDFVCILAMDIVYYICRPQG